MKKYGVVMAGGDGTRFWPLSRKKKPKQFLNLTGKELMINEAIDRLTYTVDKADIFVVTNEEQLDLMQEVTSGRIFPSHILSEPSARNTAACIGYAAFEIMKKYGDGVMVVTPSDAYIKDTASFTRTLSEAIKAAELKNKLVTIGISPTFPATGYGYIRFDTIQEEMVRTVTEFKEKPDQETAEKYIKSGFYVWNSGMFVWKVSTILKMFEEYLPDIYEALHKIADVMGTDKEYEIVKKLYPHIRKESIDYGIMEPAASKGEVLVIQGEFGWNDIGSWDTVRNIWNTDEKGNVVIGDTITVNAERSIAYSSEKLVALVGVKNLIVIETEDIIMVCQKEHAQDVKFVIEKLKHEGKERFL